MFHSIDKNRSSITPSKIYYLADYIELETMLA